MSAFSLDGRLKLDVRSFVTSTKKAKDSVEDIGDEFGKLPNDAQRGAGRAAAAVEREFSDLARPVDEIGDAFGKLPGDAQRGASKAGAAVERELGQAKGAVSEIGDEFRNLEGDARRGAADAADAVDRELGKLPDEAGDVGGMMGGKLGSKMIAGFAALGVGAMLLDLVMEGMETERIVNRVNNAFRRTAEEAAAQGRIAGELYADNWGDSLGELEHNVALTSRRIGDLTNSELASVTAGTQAVADTWGVEFDQVIRSTAQLLENGLAPSAAAALDIITAGFQDGADEAGDWLDTIDEFSQHFDAVGLSGEDMFSIITHGLQNGQRDADKMADAIKEVRLRGTDTSEATTKAFESIGLSADATRAKIVAGGGSAREAYIDILNGLKGVRDGTKQVETASQLLGTQYEDLGPNALTILSNLADGTEDVIGRNDELTDSIDRQATEWDKLSRRVSKHLATFGEEGAGLVNDAIDAWVAIGSPIEDIFSAGFGDGGAAKALNEASKAAVDAADEYGKSLDGQVSSFAEARDAAVLHAAALGMGEESYTFANRAATVWADTTGNNARKLEELAIAQMNGNNLLDVNAELAGDAADATGDLADDSGDAADEQERLAAALEEAQQQLENYVDSQRRSADAALNARAAQFDFADAVRDANEAIADPETDMQKAQEAIDDVTKASARNADAHVAAAEALAAKEGATLSDVETIDVWNDKMLESAEFAEGPLRDALIDYIALINDIPPERVSEIEAEIARGDLEKAERLLEDVSRTRQMTLNAEVWTADADAQLNNWIARNSGRTISIRTITTGARHTAMASGGIAPGGTTLVGEQGPELVNLPRGAEVFTAAETARMMTTPTPTAPVANGSTSATYNIKVDGFVTEHSMQQLKTAIREIERRKQGAI